MPLNADVSLQRKVLLLLEHLSHRDNLSTVCRLAQRACHTLRQQHDQQHQGLLPLGGSSRCSSPEHKQQQQQQEEAACVLIHSAAAADLADRNLAPHTTLTSSSDPLLKAQQQLRDACDSARKLSTFVRPVKSAGGSSLSGSGKVGGSATAAADAAAGLAGSTLRLLKLLSLPVLDMSSLTVGGMINKGAFSEVFSGTVSGCNLIFHIVLLLLYIICYYGERRKGSDRTAPAVVPESTTPFLQCCKSVASRPQVSVQLISMPWACRQQPA
jgi:hypothetical protein